MRKPKQTLDQFEQTINKLEDQLPLESRALCINFKKLRLREKLTQKQFADALGVNESLIKSIEVRRFAPAPTLIVRTSKKYAVSIDWLYQMVGKDV